MGAGNTPIAKDFHFFVNLSDPASTCCVAEDAMHIFVRSAHMSMSDVYEYERGVCKKLQRWIVT